MFNFLHEKRKQDSNFRNRDPHDWDTIALITVLLVTIILVLSACSTTRTNLPPPAPEAVQVLVPVPVPCPIEEVEHKARPVDNPQVLNKSLKDTVLDLLESWAIVETENRERKAAMDNPCGESK